MAGTVFHVLNRGAFRKRLFESADDYERFIGLLRDAIERVGLCVFAYCVMPNHFHLVVQPDSDTQLPQFMHWLTGTHAQRWRIANDTCGDGAVYQARYKAIPVQTDDYFLALARYVERNPVRAGLVARAEEWQWSSLWHRRWGRVEFPLAGWPVERPENWVELVNETPVSLETNQIRGAINRGCALGNSRWQEEMARTLRIPGYFRKSGRPRRCAT